MAKDYYDQDPGPSANAPDMEEGGDEPKSGDERMEETALVPLSVLGKGAKVGDICKFKVVHMYEDEAEIEYVKDEKEEKAESPEQEMEEHPVDRMARQTGEM